MNDIVINGTTFDGNPDRPVGVSMQLRKIGRHLEGKDGTPNQMHRGFKRTFTITWERATTGTLDIVRAIRLLTTTFTYVNEFGASFTVQNSSEDDYVEEFAFTSAAGAYYYNLELILREA